MADNGKSKNQSVWIVLRVLTSLLIRIAGCVLVAFLFFYGIRRAYRFGYSIFTEKAVAVEADAVDVLVTIEEGMSDSQIAELMKAKGLIRDETIFRILLKLYTSKSYDVLPGTYTLDNSLDPVELIGAMSGKVEVDETEAPHLFEEEP